MATTPGFTELRIEVTDELMAQIDAIVTTDRLKGRADVVVPAINHLIHSRISSSTVLLRLLGINPLDPESFRKFTGK